MSDYMDDYTSRNRTRIYRRTEADTTSIPADPIGQTQAIEPPKPKLFDGVSGAQVIAGAAAAATSVALASYIGFAGSIIGAAVSSIVTVISSQLYRRFLDESARKIKNANILNMTVGHHSEQAEDLTTDLGGTRVRGARIAPSELREKAAAERAVTQKKVIAFSVVAAAAAVVIVTAVILIGTAGQGIGEKTSPLIPQATVTDKEATDEEPTYSQSYPTDSGKGGAATGTTGSSASTDQSTDASSSTNASTGTQDQGTTSTDSQQGASTDTGSTGGSSSTGGTSGTGDSSSNTGTTDNSTSTGSGTSDSTGSTGTGSNTSGNTGTSSGDSSSSSGTSSSGTTDTGTTAKS